MLQKSQTTTWMFWKPCKLNGYLIFTTSTGEFTGFLNHPTERPVANFDLSRFFKVKDSVSSSDGGSFSMSSCSASCSLCCHVLLWTFCVVFINGMQTYNMSFFLLLGISLKGCVYLSKLISVHVHLDLSCKHPNADANLISSASWTILWKRKWWYETRETHVTQISTHLPPTIMHQLAILETINSPFEEKLSFYCQMNTSAPGETRHYRNLPVAGKLWAAAHGLSSMMGWWCIISESKWRKSRFETSKSTFF